MVNPTPVPGQTAPGTVNQPKPTTVAAPPAQPQQATQPAPAEATGEQGEEKKKKVAKPKTGVSRPRLPKFDENHVITVLRPNAKTRNSGDRFNAYVTGMTVKQYIDKMAAEPFKRTLGQVYADLRWDTDPNRKLINIGPEVVPVPEQPVKEPKKTKAEKAEAKPEQTAA